MIDFKQWILKEYDINKFLRDFKPDEFANLRTGEIKYPIKHSDGPIDLLICRERKTGKEYLKFIGSLHKWYNFYNSNDSHNYDDFNIIKILESVKRLQEKYSIDGSQIEFKTLEFGLNISTSFDPLKIIDLNTIHSQGKTHSRRLTYRSTGMFKEFDSADFWLKIYDKGKQNFKNEFILRIEVKIKRKRAINKLGIFTIQDLYNRDCLDNLFQYLNSQVKKLIIVDEVQPKKEFSEYEKEVFETFTNVNRYNNFRAKVSRQTVSNYNLEFFRILNSHKLNRYKTEILRKMEIKFQELTEVDEFQISEIPVSSDHNLTNSTHYITGIRQRVYPDYVYTLHPDHPKRKRLRNQNSNPRNNLKRSILRKIKKLENKNNKKAKLIKLQKEQVEMLEYWRNTEYDPFKQIQSLGYYIRIAK